MFRTMCGVLLAVVLLTTGVAAQDSRDYRFIKLDGHYVKWGVPMMGGSARVTYAYVDRPLGQPAAHNCRAMVPIDALLARSGITRDAFEREVASAFAIWEAAAGITFTRAADPATADILIGAQAVPRHFAYTNVTYEDADKDGSESSVRPIARSLICLNPAKRWKIGFDRDLGIYDLRYTMAHEIGHAIGLDHPGPKGQLMGFAYGERFEGLQPGDIAGVRKLYGPRATPVLPDVAVSAAAAERGPEVVVPALPH